MALFDSRDSFHKEAVHFRDSFILNYRAHLFTTNYVLSEGLSHLTYLGRKRLRSLIDEIRNPASPLKITELWIEPATVEKALPIFFNYLGHDFSITNCTSFVVMKQHEIDCAFTFDNDYRIYRFRRGREQLSFWKLPELYQPHLNDCRDRGLIR
jgi:uncharacterized protein